MSQSDIGHTKGQHHHLATRKKKLRCSPTTCLEKIAKKNRSWFEKKTYLLWVIFNKTIPWNFPMAFLSQTPKKKQEDWNHHPIKGQWRYKAGYYFLGFYMALGWEPRSLRFPSKAQERLSLNTFIGAQKIHDFCLDGSCCKGRSSQTLRSCLVLFWISWESEAAFLEKRMQVKKRWFQILIP